MFGLILEMQQGEYGPNDRRCHVTMEKIKMMKSNETTFQTTIEKLHKVFSIPSTSNSVQPSPSFTSPVDSFRTPQVDSSKTPQVDSSNDGKALRASKSHGSFSSLNSSKSKTHKNKMLK